jgi:hypothetical protein
MQQPLLFSTVLSLQGWRQQQHHELHLAANSTVLTCIACSLACGIYLPYSSIQSPTAALQWTSTTALQLDSSQEAGVQMATLHDALPFS